MMDHILINFSFEWELLFVVEDVYANGVALLSKILIITGYCDDFVLWDNLFGHLAQFELE